MGTLLPTAGSDQFQDFIFNDRAIPEDKVNALIALTGCIDPKMYYANKDNNTQQRFCETQKSNNNTILNKESIATLAPKTWLNDVIIHSWLSW